MLACDWELCKASIRLGSIPDLDKESIHARQGYHNEAQKSVTGVSSGVIRSKERVKIAWARLTPHHSIPVSGEHGTVGIGQAILTIV